MFPSLFHFFGLPLVLWWVWKNKTLYADWRDWACMIWKDVCLHVCCCSSARLGNLLDVPSSAKSSLSTQHIDVRLSIKEQKRVNLVLFKLIGASLLWFSAVEHWAFQMTESGFSTAQKLSGLSSLLLSLWSQLAVVTKEITAFCWHSVREAAFLLVREQNFSERFFFSEWFLKYLQVKYLKYLPLNVKCKYSIVQAKRK